MEMKMNLYVIRDLVADECGPVFEANNDAVAVRNFKNLLQKDGVYPEDYELLLVGNINRKIGEVYGEQAPVLVYNENVAAAEMLKKKEIS